MSRRGGEALSADDFSDAFVGWVDHNRDLLGALLALRGIGPEGAAALEALLDLKRVAVFRLSWELWAALVEGAGGDAEELLLEVVPLDVLEHVRDAVFGDRWSDDASGGRRGRPRLRVVLPNPESIARA